MTPASRAVIGNADLEKYWADNQPCLSEIWAVAINSFETPLDVIRARVCRWLRENSVKADLQETEVSDFADHFMADMLAARKRQAS
jgi:hypothetical protein